MGCSSACACTTRSSASAGGTDWSRFALELGYFDQAHFNRDFRAVVGRSPGEYAREAAAA